jgi:hypothetical protein
LARPESGADQPTSDRSRTIRMLLVLACSRSSASSISLGGASVDHRLPTSRISPDAASWRSRRTVLAWFSPAALAILPVVCSPFGSSRSTLLTRSSRCGARRSGMAALGSAAPAGGASIRSRPSRPGGASPYRARQAGHMTSASPPSGRTTENSRQRRPVRQTAQRRPARSIAARSLGFNVSTLFKIAARRDGPALRAFRRAAGDVRWIRGRSPSPLRGGWQRLHGGRPRPRRLPRPPPGLILEVFATAYPGFGTGEMTVDDPVFPAVGLEVPTGPFGAQSGRILAVRCRGARAGFAGSRGTRSERVRGGSRAPDPVNGRAVPLSR